MLIIVKSLHQLGSFNNYNNKMQINLSFFEDCLSKRDKKDLYSRPLTALLGNRLQTGTSQQGNSLSFLTRRRDSQFYNNYQPKNQKKSYRNIRSASLYGPQTYNDKSIKLQILNNACLKKVYLGRNNSHHKKNSIYDVNQTLSHSIEHDYSKKENQKPKFQSKKLKALRVIKPNKINEGLSQQGTNIKPMFVKIVGTKIL